MTNEQEQIALQTVRALQAAYGRIGAHTLSLQALIETVNRDLASVVDWLNKTPEQREAIIRAQNPQMSNGEERATT